MRPELVANAIRFERVTKSFGNHVVLDDMSFDVPRATVFCLLGRSGTGKSVTLKHAIGLLRPDSGRVWIEGHDVTTLDSRELSRVRQRMGFLFQHAALFDSLTIGENVAFPLRRHRPNLSEADVCRIATEKLQQVGLATVYDTMPAALSGGMRKRAGLARAMALDPAVLLVDEPSAGLDPITAAEIDRLLLQLKERNGTTLLVVTHNIPSARAISDQLALLHEGKIVVRGAPSEVDRSSHPVARAFMKSQGAG